MNGQLLLLLLSMLLQNPNGEILPERNRNGTAFGNPTALLPGNPASAIPEPFARGQQNVGYASDPSDGNKFCLIVQIPPDKIGEFARGPVGQEMTVSVPDEIRHVRIEKVIFRIGTDPVERILSNPTTLSDSRPFTNPPQVVDLNNRSIVPIDQTRTPTNLATVAQSGAGFGTNTTFGNNGNASSSSYNNDGGTYPPVVPNALNDRSRLSSGLGNSGLGMTSGNTALDGNYNASLSGQANGSRPDVMPFNQNPTQPRDGFSGIKSSVNNFLVPSQTNSANSGYASSTFPYAAGNSTTPNTSGTNSSRPYNIASNSTNPPAYYDGQFGQQNSQQLGPQSGYTPTPSLLQSQQYGQPVQLQQPNYVSQNPYAAPQISPYLQAPVPVKATYQPALVDPTDDSRVASNKLLPFLLLFSIVVNVYLGVWMSHQKSVYRQKLGNLRGISASDLA